MSSGIRFVWERITGGTHTIARLSGSEWSPRHGRWQSAVVVAGWRRVRSFVVPEAAATATDDDDDDGKHGAASSRRACWRHCSGKFIFKPIIWAFRFDNSPLVCFSLPSTEGQWMFVRSSVADVCWVTRFAIIVAPVVSTAAVAAAAVVPPMTSTAAGRRPFVFRERRNDRIAAAAAVVNASR